MSPDGDARARSERGAPITGARVLAVAAPVVLSNAASPIQGAIDTAIIGHIGAVTPLAAVGIGAEIFAFLFGSFNFLQIGASGLSAQALGGGRTREVGAILARGLTLAATIGIVMILAQSLIVWAGLALFEASAETESVAARYIGWRILGAPAELGIYALFGWHAGQELTRRLFLLQIVLATLNIGLNLVFVIGLDWGVEGVAIGTVLASYLGLGLGIWMARGRIARIAPGWRPRLAELIDRPALLRLLMLNRDIFIRTFLLTLGFVWMARLGSLQSDAVLAANVVLWQFFLVSAYALDGFAIAAETLVGQAVGAGRRDRLDAAARITSLWSGGLSVLISLIFLILSGLIIDGFSSSETVRQTAREYAFWACLIPMIGFAAFQLDGIFVGATRSREMRDAMIASSVIYFPLSYAMTDAFGNHGLWAAVWIWLLLRAATLLFFYPRLRVETGRA